MNLMTLKELETIAEIWFEEQADEWVRAIADREGVEFDELRPYVVVLDHHHLRRSEIVFVIPKHTAIKFRSCGYPYERDTAKLEGGKLIGDYDWYVFRNHSANSVSFNSVKNLGQALLLARWAYEEDERAKWA